VNAGCARYMELWNLVFIQYNRNEAGEADRAARQARRHGMGFERICAGSRACRQLRRRRAALHHRVRRAALGEEPTAKTSATTCRSG
jgi:hypothetical protein